MLFNLDFASNTILSCFFLFFLIIDLYFLIPAVITQIFNLIVKLAIPIRIPSKEAKVEMETYPVIVEITISDYFIPIYFIYFFQSKFLIHVFFRHDFIFSDALLYY